MRNKKNSLYSIGVDIGATKIIFGLLKENKLIKKEKISTPSNRRDFLDKLKKNIIKIQNSKKIKGIGIGVPGILTPKKDKIVNAINLPFLNEFPLLKVLEKEFKTKILIENDGNCFTLAEALLGAGKEGKIIFGITVGSGVGGGLVRKIKMNKENKIEIYQGGFGGGMEVGHLTIKFDGEKCKCKNRGCLELYCSTHFFKKRKSPPEILLKKATQSNNKALKLFKEYGRYLGIGLVNVINLIEPDIIVIGGGISNAWRYFLPEAQKIIEEILLSSFAKRHIKIKISQLKEKAGVIGAGLLVNI